MSMGWEVEIIVHSMVCRGLSVMREALAQCRTSPRISVEEK
jgi:hypothetical protein